MTFEPSGVNEPPEKPSYVPPWTRSVSVPSEFSTTRSSGPRYDGSPRLMSSFEPSLDHARGSPPRSVSWTWSSGPPGPVGFTAQIPSFSPRSEEHTSELQSRENLVCRLLLEKKKKSKISYDVVLNLYCNKMP